MDEKTNTLRGDAYMSDLMEAYQNKNISEKEVIFEMGTVLIYALKALDEAGVRVMVDVTDREPKLWISEDK